MKKFVIQIVLLVSVISMLTYFFSPARSGKIDVPFLSSKPTKSILQINDISLDIEVANTSSKRSKGLSGRASLGEKEGMLFVFDKADKHPFWMKGLSFPLDFVWIKGDKVVGILENILPPTEGQKDSDLQIYSSNTEVDKVLELNGGSIKKFNIKVGDTIKVTTI